MSRTSLESPARNGLDQSPAGATMPRVVPSAGGLKPPAKWGSRYGVTPATPWPARMGRTESNTALVRHAASPPPVPVAVGDVAGAAGVLVGACGVVGCVGCAGTLAVVVTVWVTVVAGTSWLGEEPQAASSEVAVSAPVNHATRRCTRPDVFAVITRLTLLIEAGSMLGMRAGVRVAVDMTGSFERRCGQ